jgi:hypothetical protein
VEPAGYVIRAGIDWLAERLAVGKIVGSVAAIALLILTLVVGREQTVLIHQVCLEKRLEECRNQAAACWGKTGRALRDPSRTVRCVPATRGAKRGASSEARTTADGIVCALRGR